MGEPTLNYTLLQIKKEVARLLGFDFVTISNWTTEETSHFDTAFQAGLNKFYYAGGTENEPNHEWSFLRETNTITLVNGTASYAVSQDDFSGIILDDSVTYGSGKGHHALTRISETQHRVLQGTESDRATPRLYAIHTQSFSLGVESLRYNILVHPTPSADDVSNNATVTFGYKTFPDFPTGDTHYVRAPAIHGKTVLEAVLSEAEALIDDEGEGVHEMRYRQCLVNSIRHDRHMKDSELAGKSSFPSENLEDDSLRVTYFTLLRRVGKQIGYGFNHNMWSHAQLQDVDQIIESGYRKFLYPDPIDMTKKPHQWSFLRPVGGFSTSNATAEYALPADVESIRSSITFAPAGTNSNYPPITQVPVSRILELQYQEGHNSHPRYFAIASNSSNSSTDQGQTLILHPAPDKVYELQYEYEARQRRLSEEYPHPLGNIAFAELVLSSCLAEAELQKSGSRGHQYGAYLSRLATAISQDYSRGPSNLGYNGNGSLGSYRGRGSLRRADLIHSRNVTYN